MIMSILLSIFFLFGFNFFGVPSAGVALGSGGTQLRKGPVYTERVLYARVDATGRVCVEDSLGLQLPPGTPSSVAPVTIIPPAV